MDLSINYLGLLLKNPIVPSAGPLTSSLESMKRLEDAGASAVVLHSLFEEQLRFEATELDHYLDIGIECSPEALSYFPKVVTHLQDPHEYIELIHSAKRSLDIPVIASLNGTTVGGWTRFAREMEQAGADALELNIYYLPTDPELSGRDVEEKYIEILRAVRKEVTMPLAMKVSPFYTAFGQMAQRFVNEGADGLVLFNRFYQPDINIEELELVPSILLSTPFAMRIPMRWIAILFGRVKASLAATSGIHTAEDVLKMIMAGADVTMMCSALIKNGHTHITKVLTEIERWMAEHEYNSIQQMKGSMSQMRVSDPSAYERAHYFRSLSTFKTHN